MPDILSPESINNYLKNKVFNITSLEETGSTNDAARKAAESGAPEFTLITAERQTNGRGRLGRSFFSPQSTGIYFTLVLRPSMPPEDSLFITAAAAVSVASAIETVCGKQAGIKWVNDIFVGGKKVCGILTEGSLTPDGSRFNYAVLGVGVNVAPPSGGFPDGLENIAACLYPDGSYPDGVRAQLLAAILDNFYALYTSFPDKRFLDDYRRRSILTGADVTVIQGETPYPAHVVGIDEGCHLLVSTEDGKTLPLTGGEVSIRLK